MSVLERLSTNFLSVRKPLLELYENSSSNDYEGDIGFFSAYYDTNAGSKKYTGLFRDQSDNNKYKLFTGLSAKPSNNDSIDTTNLGFTLADLNIGALDAKTTVTVGTDLTVGGDSTLNGSLQVNGSSATFACQQMAIYDNIVVDNVSDIDANYAGNDAGYVSGRIPLNVGGDIAKVANRGLVSNFASTDTTIEMGVGTGDEYDVYDDYYVGWAIKKNTNEIRIITADVINNGRHVLTIASAFGSDGKVGSTTFNLYNKTNVGWVWDESKDQLSAFAFPRDNVSTLDPDATDGSAPEYVNIKVGDIEVLGTLSANINPLKVQTILSSTTLVEANLKTYSIWFISASLANDITVTLPDTSTIVNNTLVSYRVTIANLSTHKITIAKQNADTIEGEPSYIMKNQYDKMTFISYAGGWLIE